MEGKRQKVSRDEKKGRRKKEKKEKYLFAEVTPPIKLNPRFKVIATETQTGHRKKEKKKKPRELHLMLSSHHMYGV